MTSTNGGRDPDIWWTGCEFTAVAGTELEVIREMARVRLVRETRESKGGSGAYFATGSVTLRLVMLLVSTVI